MIPLRFLFSGGGVAPAPKLLVVQSGPAELLGELVARVRTVHADARVTVLLRRGLDELPEPMRAIPGVEYVENLGPRWRTVRDLRSRRFDGAFVLHANHPGYWKLKLLPFALGVPTVYGVNEHLGYFPISLREAPRVAAHLIWRMRGPAGAGFGVIRGVGQKAAFPARMAFLVAYERIANARARARGAGNWKSARRE